MVYVNIPSWAVPFLFRQKDIVIVRQDNMFVAMDHSVNVTIASSESKEELQKYLNLDEANNSVDVFE